MSAAQETPSNTLGVEMKPAIERLLDAAPPMTDEQLDRVIATLRLADHVAVPSTAESLGGGA